MAESSQKKTDFHKVAEVLKDLPVADVAADVVKSILAGKVTELSSETGSGKTLLANTMLADASDEPVLVLVPRRFLAINAAQTIAEIAGLNVGEQVGFAVGRQAGDESKFSDKTKLVFATYGYAISSGMIHTAKNIILDEVHEAGSDTSLARAILHRRKQAEPNLRLGEMSATMNAQKQADYWSDIADTSIHHAEGRAYPCEFRQVSPNRESLEQTAVKLIKEEGRKGIAIFKPGVKEIEATEQELRKELDAAGLKNVEIAKIYGDLDMTQRDLAIAPPAEGNAKILIGTNVIESGVNIKWLDTGISDGTGKVPYMRQNGADALVLEELPQWRIIQQEGRVKRFQPGIFVLHSDTAMDARPEQQRPEIERVSLNGLVMRAAGYQVNPEELKFDARVNKDRLKQAKKDMMRLGLLNDDWSLTEKGRFVNDLPVSPEAGAMLYAAKDTPEILPDAIELAALVEVGDIRADYRTPHGFSQKSDVLDGLAAYQRIAYNRPEEQTEDEEREACEHINVSWKGFKEVRGLVQDLDRRLGRFVDLDTARAATDAELQKVMLHGSVNKMFKGGHSNVSQNRGQRGKGRQNQDEGGYHDLSHAGRSYPAGKGSVAEGNSQPYAIAGLRAIPQRSGGELTIVQNITKIPRDLFLEFATEHGGILQNISFQTDRRGRDSFTATYMGDGEKMTFPIPNELTPVLDRLIGDKYAAYKHSRGEEVGEQGRRKPYGQQNSQVRELRAQQQERAL